MVPAVGVGASATHFIRYTFGGKPRTHEYSWAITPESVKEAVQGLKRGSRVSLSIDAKTGKVLRVSR